MKANESKTDRILRAIVGAVLLMSVFLTGGPLKWVLLVLAIISLITAITGFCLLYKIFGFSTFKNTKE